MNDTYSDSKLFYYKYTNPIEVWGNSLCKISFCNPDGTIIYSRNTWYHHLNSILKKELQPSIFVYWIPSTNIAVAYEYERPSIYELVAIDFDKEIVFRTSLIDKPTEEYSEQNILEKITQNSSPTNLILEKIKKPLFSFWRS